MRDRIYITEADFEKLRRLVEGRRSGPGPDAGYLDILEQELDRADVVANARARLVELLPSVECRKSRVAAALSMSTSTLHQRLIERGTSFHALLNDLRRELACSYLQQSGVSVTEITFLLGFTDVSNFTRAFKRWTGMSPTRFRELG